jgi:preprotein translocase subunit YajC
MGLRSRDPERFVVETMLWGLADSITLFAAGDQKDYSSPMTLLFPLAAMIALFYFLVHRPQKREQARRQQMLGGVKKNDRVVTIGGVYGVVSNVNREADEVTIRVDESTNTKLRVTLSSIGRILGDEPSDESVKK